MRDTPSADAQLKVISQWLQRYGNRRPSEAAMEVTSYSAGKRLKMFRNLLALKCIEHTAEGWKAVRNVPSVEQIALDDEIS